MRFIVKFVNGAWAVFDRHLFKNVSTHGLRSVANSVAQRRERN